MEKKKYSLCLEVLRRMGREGVLDEAMLVGSWCVFLYNDYFSGKAILPPLRTRDLDFLFPIPLKRKREIDLFELLKDLGFILDYKGEQGYITFMHPDLILEFLAPERGKGTLKPLPIAQLGINAQALRFMDMLFRDPIQTSFEDVKVRIPHPADFALHKILIAKRRKEYGKAEKDKTQAIALLKALIETKRLDSIQTAYNSIPKTWRDNIIRELGSFNESIPTDIRLLLETLPQ